MTFSPLLMTMLIPGWHFATQTPLNRITHIFGGRYAAIHIKSPFLIPHLMFFVAGLIKYGFIMPNKTVHKLGQIIKFAMPPNVRLRHLTRCVIWILLHA